MFRKLWRERLERGKILKQLREQFFKASTEILDPDQFFVKLREDLVACQSHAVIISPFLRKETVAKFLNFKEVRDVLQSEKKVVVVVRPAEDDQVGSKNVKEQSECIKMLREGKVKVVEKPQFHFKAAIIDDSIIYIGSINPLSIITIYYVPADFMLRFVSEALVDEVVEKFVTKEEYASWLSS